MKVAPRLDVPVGNVPDYATFVRHVWRYRDEDGCRVISTPPWMYSVLFEDAEEVGFVFTLIEALASTQAGCGEPLVNPSRFSVVVRQTEDGTLPRVYEVRFADLSALHVFLLMLATQSSLDDVARQVGEFLMWTLGFRWV